MRVFPFDRVQDGSWHEVRRNYATNALMSGSVTGWVSTGGVPAWDDGLSVTLAADEGVYLDLVVPGTLVSAGVEVETTSPYRVALYDPTGTSFVYWSDEFTTPRTVTFDGVTLVAGQPLRLMVVSLTGGSVKARNVVVETTLTAGSPFDGGTATGNADLRTSWVGAPNASFAVMEQANYVPVASDLTPHTLIEVDDLDPGVEFITVWRDDGTRWSEVRGAVMAPVAGSWAGVDWECGFNRATAYRVEQFDSAGLSLGFLPAVTVTLASQETWVHNVMAPKGGVAVMATDKAFADIDRPYDSELVYARGATYGTAVGSARRGIVGVNLEMVTDTLEQADKVQALLGSPGNELPPVLCVRKGAGEGFARIPATLFVHVGSINEVDLTVRFGGENVVHQASGTEVRPPAKKLGTPLLTLADLDAYYDTLGDIDADNLTLGDIDRRWDLAGYANV